MPRKAKQKNEPKGKGTKIGRRIPLSMRTTPKLRDALEREANINGRSLLQETELRLEQSFQYENMFMLFNTEPEKTKELLRHIVGYVTWTSRAKITGFKDGHLVSSPHKHWWEDKAVAETLSEELAIIVDVVLTGRGVVAIEDAATEMQKFIGGEYANDSPARIAVRSYLLTMGLNLKPEPVRDGDKGTNA
jgi:hypothetical protein